MERVAERAGVSKALPYTHFANADDLLVAVYRREIADHRRRIRDGLSSPGHDASRAGFRAYFDTVQARQMLFSMLMTPTHTPGPLREQQLAFQDESEHYFAHRYRERLGVRDSTALIAACVMLASLQGTVRAWTKSYGSEQEIEDAFATMIDAGLRALRDAEDARGAPARRRRSPVSPRT
jgi:AcrR family transcriptional regulator